MSADDLQTTTGVPPAATPLSIHTAASAILGFACTAIWGLTGGGTFWPIWVWFGLAVPLGVHAAVRAGLDAQTAAPPALRIHAALGVVAVATVIAIWALTGAGPLWFFWPLLAFGVTLAAHALWWQVAPRQQHRALEERVDELTRTRRGALDVQEAELRRIERDLHDGAQARLVALTMTLGRAEMQLEDKPEVADLVRRARAEAGEAIAELRDLARGIAPPVLADRGLAAAVDALARRTPVDVTVHTDLEGRLPAVVETAAYFVVAEALTNVAKHAPRSTVHLSLVREPHRVVAVVADDGPGGADPDGGGLTGLRHRVEALDGRLRVTSAPGAGTTIRAELPCES